MYITECPRDAIQGLTHFIPTATKVAYIDRLLKVNFDVLDCGSFVSPKAIPQLADTSEVLSRIDLENSSTKLLCIVANQRGIQALCKEEKVSIAGYPWSVSETFQQRNTNKSIAAAFDDIKQGKELLDRAGKELLVYLSMGFGNPYGDPYNAELVEEQLERLVGIGVSRIALADTVGSSDYEGIMYLLASIDKYVNPPKRMRNEAISKVKVGVHFHSTPDRAARKIEAALASGCQRFDVAALGYGGCPMAKDDLTGNIDTRVLLSELKRSGKPAELNYEAWEEALQFASQEVFKV